MKSLRYFCPDPRFSGRPPRAAPQRKGRGLFEHGDLPLKRGFCQILSILFLTLTMTACQNPTKVVVIDEGLEDRSFGKIEYGKKFDLKKAVIVDTRTRFEHEMSKLPRSFHLYWKDVDLKDYRGIHKAEKVRRLQKFLALKGVDPYTRVVILGKGLKGNGEEFFVASALLSLGVKMINFMDQAKLKDSLTSRNVPPLENLPYWEKKMVYDYECYDKRGPDYTISSKRVNLKGFSLSQRMFLTLVWK